jgi:orotate phosphoribosyltransferase
LAGDLARGGYIRGAFVFATGEEASTYFEKYLVLSRPGLLRHAAELLRPQLPEDADALAADGAGSLMLATALSLSMNLPLLPWRSDVHQSRGAFAGEVFPGMRAIVVEDVVLSGHRSLNSLALLRRAGVIPIAVATLLDRERGGRARIESSDVPLIALFLEHELLP